MLKPKKKLNFFTEVNDALVELTFWQRIQAYWGTNKNTLIYGGIGAILIIAGLIYWVNRQAEGTTEAAAELSTIQSYYDAGQYPVAIAGDSLKLLHGQQVKGLQSIVDNYGSTTPGKVASLYLANCYYYTGQYDKAQEYYGKAESISDPIFAAAGYAGEGAVLQSKKNFDEAAKYFQRAAQQSDANPNDADYLVNAARCFAGSSQPTKAIELYTRVVYEFAGTSAEETARRALAVLHSEPL